MRTKHEHFLRVRLARLRRKKSRFSDYERSKALACLWYNLPLLLACVLFVLRTAGMVDNGFSIFGRPLRVMCFVRYSLTVNSRGYFDRFRSYCVRLLRILYGIFDFGARSVLDENSWATTVRPEQTAIRAIVILSRRSCSGQAH